MKTVHARGVAPEDIIAPDWTLDHAFGPVETPPCDAVREVKAVAEQEEPCGKPSVIRVRLHCLGCSRRRAVFLCAEHYDDVARKSRGKCIRCPAGTPYTVTEI